MKYAATGGLPTVVSEDALRALKQLLTEYEPEHGLSDTKKQSDEDYVNKLDLDDL